MDPSSVSRCILALDDDVRVAYAARINLEIPNRSQRAEISPAFTGTTGGMLTLGRFLQPMTTRVTRPILSGGSFDDFQRVKCGWRHKSDQRQ